MLHSTLHVDLCSSAHTLICTSTYSLTQSANYCTLHLRNDICTTIILTIHMQVHVHEERLGNIFREL